MPGIDDRSFVRFGGAAAILLALTSWAAAVAYVTVADGGTQVIGVQVFQLLYGLVALWSILGVLAVHQVTRVRGEAWSLFAALVGVLAASATLAAALYTVAYIRVHTALPDIVPVDPLHLATFGMTGLWFVAANLLLWRTTAPRRLVLLGIVDAVVLLTGFVAALAGNVPLTSYAALAAGVAGGPVYWIWLGAILRRRAAL